MIDLHNHVLPAIDDGARDLAVSSSMLELFSTIGASRLVATPHLFGPLTDKMLLKVQRAVDETRPLAHQYGIGLDVGFEHVIARGLVDRLVGGEPSTLAGSRSVLVETPSFSWPHLTADVLFELQVAGFQPVLAHPERYPEVQQNPSLALDVAGRGAVLQITSSSLVGVGGPAAKRTARILVNESIDRQLLMVLASDAHSPGERLSRVGAGLDWFRGQYEDGDGVVHWATSVVPDALLDTADDAPARLEHLRHQSFSRSKPRLQRRTWTIWKTGANG